MSLKRISAVIALGAAVLLSACATSVAPVPALASFSTLSVKEVSVLECDPQKPKLEMAVELRYVSAAESPEVRERVNAEILRAALPKRNVGKSYDDASDFAGSVQRYIDDEVASYQETWREIFEDWGHSSGSENAIVIEGSPRRLDETLLVYDIRIMQDLGGAHPSHTRKMLNFDLKTGKRLALKDFFKPGSVPELDALLARKAAAKALLASGFPKPTATENFAVEPDGISFVFNAGEIAPHASGIITLKLLNFELKNLLRSPAEI